MGGWLFFQEINFWGIFWCGLVEHKTLLNEVIMINIHSAVTRTPPRWGYLDAHTRCEEQIFLRGKNGFWTLAISKQSRKVGWNAERATAPGTSTLCTRCEGFAGISSRLHFMKNLIRVIQIVSGQFYDFSRILWFYLNAVNLKTF